MKKAPDPPTWKNLAPNIWKTDLGDDLPEIIVLRVSHDEFTKMTESHDAAMAYFDEPGYLKRKLVNCEILRLLGEKGSTEDWLICGFHKTESWLQMTAWQLTP